MSGRTPSSYVQASLRAPLDQAGTERLAAACNRAVSQLAIHFRAAAFFDERDHHVIPHFQIEGSVKKPHATGQHGERIPLPCTIGEVKEIFEVILNQEQGVEAGEDFVFDALIWPEVTAEMEDHFAAVERATIAATQNGKRGGFQMTFEGKKKPSRLLAAWPFLVFSVLLFAYDMIERAGAGWFTALSVCFLISFAANFIKPSLTDKLLARA